MTSADPWINPEIYPFLLFLGSTLFLLFAIAQTATHRSEDLESPIQYHIEPQVPTEQDGDAKLSLEASESLPRSHDLIYPICPADGRRLGPPIATCTASETDDAISKAKIAQIRWSQSSFAQRRKLLNTLLRYVLDHQEEIVEACCLDSGKTKVDAFFGEILVTAEKLQWTIKHGEKALKPSNRPTNLLMWYKKNVVYYEPMGVVAACISWNYPFHNFISPIITALFTGNAIVVKPSEQTAWSSRYFLDIVQGALSSCGHEPNLVQSLICWPATAAYLTSHPSLSHIIFIGSRPVAHQVLTSAARALTPVTLELGGKDPAIVLDDAKTVRNLGQVADILMRGVFQSAGQNCVGIERVIALPEVHDKLVDTILQKIQGLKVGHPLRDDSTAITSTSIKVKTPNIDMGSLISSESFQALTSQVRSAVSAGAILHTGGTPLAHPNHPNGSYFTPTFLSNIQPHMSIAQNELFAPIFLLMRASNVTEAIEMANSTNHCLGASIFGHDRKSVNRCIKEVKAGMISVNDMGSYYAVSMPFGGGSSSGSNTAHPSPPRPEAYPPPPDSARPMPTANGSGYGRFSSVEGLRALCNIKAVCRDRSILSSWFGVRTVIPGPLAYPIADADKAWRMCKAVLGLGYGMDVWEKIEAVLGLVVAMGVMGIWGEKKNKKEKEKEKKESWVWAA